MEKDFINPVGKWSFSGTYTVELTSTAPKRILPPGIKVENNKIVIPDGRVEHIGGNILLYNSMERCFSWQYSSINCIRDLKGELIWLNREYRKELLRVAI